MSDNLNLYQKIVEVRKSIGNIKKDATAGKNSKFSYDYVSGSSILNKIKDEMNNQRLLFIPIIKNKKMDRIEYNDRYGKPAVTYIVELDLDYKWINADNPEETFVINFYAVGEQTDPSKAFGTALTYSERYILLKEFNLPTDEDDADGKEVNKNQYYNQQNNNYQNNRNNYQRQQQRQATSTSDNKLPVQDKGKLLLAQQKATDLADVINSQDDADENNPITQEKILNGYVNKVGATDLSKATNEQLINIVQLIDKNIEKYKNK
ncbi:ERF family protein [Staphylococcus epidermidis]|uniref:ERF family protein n=1 Tax=Staphylococcus epidermidis TaxID=1282 RepID=UPI001C404689|nr:ERF family protein [Staphylococcus epidermidis]